MAAADLVRQVEVHCAERGRALALAWNLYTAGMSANLGGADHSVCCRKRWQLCFPPAILTSSQGMAVSVRGFTRGCASVGLCDRDTEEARCAVVSQQQAAETAAQNSELLARSGRLQAELLESSQQLAFLRREAVRFQKVNDVHPAWIVCVLAARSGQGSLDLRVSFLRPRRQEARWWPYADDWPHPMFDSHHHNQNEDPC